MTPIARFLAALTLFALTGAARADVWSPGSASAGFPPVFGHFYRYAPSVVQDTPTTRQAFFCANQSADEVRDHVITQRAFLQGGAWVWGPERVVLAPTSTGWDGKHLCDPEVVAGAFKVGTHTYSWALFYTGAHDSGAQTDLNGIAVAFADSIDGTWYRWGELVPYPDASCTDAKGCWGVGQPSVTSIDGKGRMLLFYTQATNLIPTRVVRREIDLSDMSAPQLGSEVPVLTDGLVAQQGSSVVLRNVSVVYDGYRDKFVIARETETDARIASVTEVASIPGAAVWSGDLVYGAWQPLYEIGSATSGFPFNHNAGIVRSLYGTLLDPHSLDVYFTVASGNAPVPDLYSYRVDHVAGPIGPSLPASPPVVASNADGRLEIFARDSAFGPLFSVWHKYQLAPGGDGGWQPWMSLGASPAGDPIVEVNQDGRLELFARATDGTIWHDAETAAGAATWTGWASLGAAPAGTLVVARDGQGRLTLLVRQGTSCSTENQVWWSRQNSPNQAVSSGGWTSWFSLGASPCTDPVVGIDLDGRLELFARAYDNTVWHNAQTSVGGSQWTGWVSLGGGFGGRLAVARGGDGRLALFSRQGASCSLENDVWWRRQNDVNQPVSSGGWSAWASLGPSPCNDPVVGVNQDGRLELFARASDSTVWRNAQTSSGGWTFTGWSNLGAAPASNPVVARNQDGRLELFARASDNTVWHNLQTAANTSSYTGWSTLFWPF
jgi:hypothetical protein